jgi:predicted HicB family RNase H-like nuclease
MSGSVHNSTAKLRINRELYASAEAMARQQGMTFSEWMRHAMRRELQQAERERA